MKAEGKNWRKSCCLFSYLFKSLLFFALFTGLLSCKTFFKKKSPIPPYLDSYTTGTFSGALLIFQGKKKHYFSADIFISGKDKLRLDLSASLGIPVLTMLWHKERVTLLFLQKKEFYKGSDLKTVLPSFLENFEYFFFNEIFFDRKPIGKKWSCEMSQENRPVRCQYSKQVVQWKRGDRRSLTFKSPDFSFTFQYSLFSPKVDDGLFTVQIPQDFKPVFLLK